MITGGKTYVTQFRRRKFFLANKKTNRWKLFYCALATIVNFHVWQLPRFFQYFVFQVTSVHVFKFLLKLLDKKIFALKTCFLDLNNLTLLPDRKDFRERKEQIKWNKSNHKSLYNAELFSWDAYEGRRDSTFHPLSGVVEPQQEEDFPGNIFIALRVDWKIFWMNILNEHIYKALDWKFANFHLQNQTSISQLHVWTLLC